METPSSESSRQPESDMDRQQPISEIQHRLGVDQETILRAVVSLIRDGSVDPQIPDSQIGLIEGRILQLSRDKKPFFTGKVCYPMLTRFRSRKK